MGYQVIPTGVEGSISHGIANATKLWSDYVAAQTQKQIEASRRAGKMEESLSGIHGPQNYWQAQAAIDAWNKIQQTNYTQPGAQVNELGDVSSGSPYNTGHLDPARFKMIRDFATAQNQPPQPKPQTTQRIPPPGSKKYKWMLANQNFLKNLFHKEVWDK